MEYFLQQLINGLTLGAIYGLIAIGYTMVYGIIGMINFAHGEIFMIGAFSALVAFLLMAGLNITFLPLVLLFVIVFSLLFTASYGWAIEKFAYKPLRHSNRLAPFITAIGMSIFLQNFAQITQGSRDKPLEPILKGGFDILQSDGFNVHINYMQILIMVLTVLLMLIFTYLIVKTNLGRMQRACAQDKKMAALLGIDVNKVISTTFIIGAALAAVAGTIYLLYYGIARPYMGFIIGIKAFTAAVLGGIGSLPGAMLGGVLIGLIETFWSGYFSNAYKDVAAFSILVLVLIFRPSGLLGKPEVEKV